MATNRTAQVLTLRPPAWDWSAFAEGSLALEPPDVWEDAPPSPRLALLQGRASECVFAGGRDIGYGAAHALAPSRAGAPHVEGPSFGETKNPAYSRTGRGLDRAHRHVSAHSLRQQRLVSAHADAPRARESVPAGRSAAPAGRRAARVAPPAAPDRAGPRYRDRLPRHRRRRACDGAGRRARQTRAFSSGSRASSSAATGTACPTTARRRDWPEHGVARRGRSCGHRHLLASRRDDRRDHAADAPRPDLRIADRHPADERARTRRARHAPPAGSGADGRARPSQRRSRRSARSSTSRTVEQQALARYTQDAGNHVSFEIHPAASLATP